MVQHDFKALSLELCPPATNADLLASANNHLAALMLPNPRTTGKALISFQTWSLWGRQTLPVRPKTLSNYLKWAKTHFEATNSLVTDVLEQFKSRALRLASPPIMGGTVWLAYMAIRWLFEPNEPIVQRQIILLLFGHRKPVPLYLRKILVDNWSLPALLYYLTLMDTGREVILETFTLAGVDYKVLVNMIWAMLHYDRTVRLVTTDSVLVSTWAADCWVQILLARDQQERELVVVQKIWTQMDAAVLYGSLQGNQMELDELERVLELPESHAF